MGFFCLTKQSRLKVHLYWMIPTFSWRPYQQFMIVFGVFLFTYIRLCSNLCFSADYKIARIILRPLQTIQINLRKKNYSQIS